MSGDIFIRNVGVRDINHALQELEAKVEALSVVGDEVTESTDSVVYTMGIVGDTTIYPGTSGFKVYAMTFSGSFDVTVSTAGCSGGEETWLRFNPVSYTPTWTGIALPDSGEPTWKASEWNWWYLRYNEDSGDWDAISSGIGYATS